MAVSRSWQSTLQTVIALCLSEYLNTEDGIVILNIRISQQVLEFAIPYLTVRVADIWRKHYKQICDVATEGFDMIYKCYKQIRSMTVQWTNWWEVPYGLIPR